MADTIRTRTATLAQWTLTGAAKRLVPQYVRDFIVSAVSWMSPPFTTLVDGATVTWATGGDPISRAKVTLGGNRTLAITGAIDGSSGTLIVTQDGTGSRTLTLPAGSKAAGGSITLSTAPGYVDVLAFVYDGTSYYWAIGKAFA